jgi:hypothetical protein
MPQISGEKYLVNFCVSVQTVVLTTLNRMKFLCTQKNRTVFFAPCLLFEELESVVDTLLMESMDFCLLCWYGCGVSAIGRRCPGLVSAGGRRCPGLVSEGSRRCPGLLFSDNFL